MSAAAPDSPAPLAPGTVVEHPRTNDVLGTRSRKDLNNHPGNVFYWKMIMNANNSDSGKAATKIYDIVTKDRKGQFLRKDVNSGYYIVLDKQLAITKIRSSLNYVTRNHKRRDGDEGDGDEEATSAGSPEAAPISKKRKRRNNDVQYVVVMNKETADSSAATLLLPYAQDLIALVCNQPNTSAAIRWLAQPSTEETPPQRSLRLQLRQRYSGAMRQGISHIAFSRKLLSEWGATLEKQERNGDAEEEKRAVCVTEESQQQEQESAAKDDDDAVDDVLDAPTPKVKNGEIRTKRLRISAEKSRQKEDDMEEEEEEDSESVANNDQDEDEEDDAGSSDSEFSFGSPPSPEKQDGRKRNAKSKNKAPEKVTRASRKLSKAAKAPALDPDDSPKNWDQWCERLVEFRAEHGHVDVPANHYPPEQKKLYDWLRSQKKRRKLTSEQSKKLRRLGVRLY